MALTITEANAVNDLLDYVTERPRVGAGPVDRRAARAAAELLADHAHKALSAGISAGDVAARWHRVWPEAGR